ncbi:thiopeptide-type bacteriocin biosynthesis protein [Streptomyces nigrescens]|uniref:Thiopeptide-type bacteriocin biosynthesis protein n=1 Tax=Streptomyces nigrescens TaxID=1920 RepID=A0ABY7JEV4_STRNI|nr:thiopeptide-type bacteriocin biosynthesis protein [Streptomyces nigrescens]WAU09018.1 thiopeptide-type bacteriocin biosynthesis protein [Streptomyces nigrescens]
MDGDRSWVSAHLFSQGNLDRLLTDLVDPLLDELRERRLADHGFFLRYWDGGPHIRLRVLPSCREAAAAVRGLIERRALAYFAHSPAPEALSQEEYLRSAREIGAWEGVRPTERMYANNSLHFLPYVPEHHRYGQGASLELVEEHFSTSSELALDLLRGAGSPEQRELAVLCHLLLAWFLGAQDVHELAGRQLAKMSARRGLGAVDAETTSDARFLRRREQLLTLATTMRKVGRAWPHMPDDSSLKRWASSVSGVVDVLGADADAPSAESAADLCAHLFANRVGVRIDAEGSLRYLAARAVTDPAVYEEA